MVRNVHERLIVMPAERPAPLVDRVGGPDDIVWPSPEWPPMVLDRPLPVEPAGPARSVVRHVLEGRLTGSARLTWPVAIPVVARRRAGGPVRPRRGGRRHRAGAARALVALGAAAAPGDAEPRRTADQDDGSGLRPDMTDFGIDLSHFNTVNDWEAVRGNGISFVSVKLTESTAHLDLAAADHVTGARAARIHAGGYHFARPGDIPGQVRLFASRLRALGLLDGGSMAPMLDMEAGALRPTANAFVADFVARLRAETGVRRVLVYANLDWFTHVLRPAEWVDPDVLLWIARFNGAPGHPGFAHPNLVLHQHSSTGTVPGIPGHVDRDATVGAHTVASLLSGGRPARTHVVVAGETLFGIARINHTTVDALVRINHIPDPAVIHPGQVLQLA